MNKYIGLLVIFVLLTGMCSCSLTNGTANTETRTLPAESVILNERQKRILKENGLSDNYNDLSDAQRKSIVAIEEMLQYAEKKYAAEFAYAGYIPAGPLEKQQLRAYPVSGYMATDTFTITKTPDGYKDDYIAVASRTLLAEYIADSISELCPQITVKVIAEITDISLETIPKEYAEFDGNAAAIVKVFVDGGSCTDQDFAMLQSKLESYMTAHQLTGLVQLLRLKEGTLPYLHEFNYTQYLSDSYCDLRVNIPIK